MSSPKKSKVSLAMERFHSWLKKTNLHDKSYQTDGVQFMLKRELTSKPLYGAKGGILADEMGLGKTIQLFGLMVSNVVQKTLIVLPKALLEQWFNEIYKLLGHTSYIYHGAGKSIDKVLEANVVITTYGAISRRKNDNGTIEPSILSTIHWNRAIFDESHKLKNPKTRAFKGTMDLNVDSKWFVTGTPIQNKVEDLYSLFLLLGISREIFMDNMDKVIQHFVIKRKRTDVGLKLPPLHKHVIHVDWKDEQERDVARSLHSCMNFTGVTKKNVHSIIKQMKMKSFGALVRMKQVCVLPKLLDPYFESLYDSGEIRAKFSLNGRSKFKKIMKTVDAIPREEKKIIFSHFTGVIDYLCAKLGGRGYKCAIIDGRTTDVMRKDIILSHDFDILILQISSCSEGLNLQQYNHVLFTSPHWNPYIEQQAIARAYRMGQKKNVHVYSFIMNGFGGESKSLDMYCVEVQDVKLMLDKEVFGD